MSLPNRATFVALLLGFSFSSQALGACVTPPAGEPPIRLPVVASQDVTLLLQEPTISKEHIVFRYAQDLWVTSRSGGEARRLTSSPGVESNPQISPDGTMVAFTGQYEGNSDVYVTSIFGGAPKRLTYHPSSDQVQDWLPDGSAVLFTSGRTSGAPIVQAWTISVAGGMPTPLELPRVGHIALNESETHFAYTKSFDAFRTWKRYRGGRLASVWIFDRATHEVEVVPEAGANDTFPAWLGGDVYFASDREGIMNLYRFTPGSDEVEALTDYESFDVRNLDTGGGLVVFEQAGSLHVFDPLIGEVEDLAICVRTDGLSSTPRWQSVENHIRNASISPNGKRAVFEARGEILTVPKEFGDVRHLTASPGAHDRNPIWSPDGNTIAWFSDKSGEYQLLVSDQLGREEPRVFDLDGAGFYDNPMFSPDGKHILYTDKGNRIAYITLESSVITEVAVVQGSLGTVSPSYDWSSDSQWVAFENRNPITLYDHIALFELASGSTTNLTDSFGAAASPAFSRDGAYLYFFASINRGPHFQGLNMSTQVTRDWDGNLYACVLKADGENPLFPESDEGVEDKSSEVAPPSEGEDENGVDLVVVPTDSADGEETKEDAPKGPSIDLEGLEGRILALPLPRGNYSDLAGGDEKLYFRERGEGRSSALKSFDFSSKKATTVKDGVNGYQVSADGKSLLLFDDSNTITDASGGDGKALPINSVKVYVDPRAEWPQILREVWRIERDYFYDSNMHGVDWDKMLERWMAMVPYVQHRDDLNMLIGELIGELCCGHEYVGGGEKDRAPEGIDMGLLGANWIQEDFRIAQILTGQNWIPSQRSPLTEPGVDAQVGDYLIAVNGVPIVAPSNLYQAFQGLANTQVELTLGSTLDEADRRTTRVVPVSSESSLRFSSWVESNRKRVDELSGGRLAYIYMPDTGGRGMDSFDRDFYSQLDREGVILDERYNGGGMVADYVVETLNRNVMSYWFNREEWLARSPSAVMPGPKVMIINERAGSGGDWMPWAFKSQGIGSLVGTRTWGGLVGISGYPSLVDGGSVTAASFGVLDTEGNWIIENEGVHPDYQVVEWPAAIIAGGDPQLEKAVQVALKQLEANTPKPLPKFHPPAPR
jgi:tricorn protease